MTMKSLREKFEDFADEYLGLWARILLLAPFTILPFFLLYLLIKAIIQYL